MKKLLLLILTLQVAVSYCQPRCDQGNVNEFLNGRDGSTYASGDSIQKIFTAKNQSILQELSNSISILPIDRCHNGRIVLWVEISLDGKMDSVALNESINHKMDSSILSIAKSMNYKWDTECNGIKSGFKGGFEFRLINDYSRVKSYREEKTDEYPSYTQTTITSGQKVQYDPDKNCKDADFYFETGVEDFKAGNYKDAINNLSKALTINPYDLDALHNLAISYLKIGNKKEACACLLKSLQYGDDVKQAAIEKYCGNE